MVFEGDKWIPEYKDDLDIFIENKIKNN